MTRVLVVMLIDQDGKIPPRALQMVSGENDVSSLGAHAFASFS
jgi:hypothetical protein